MSDGWIYYLREADGQGSELWRQHEDGQAELFKGVNDIPDECQRAAFDFLFRISAETLGIVRECDGKPQRVDQPSTESERSLITAYSVSQRDFHTIADTSLIGGSLTLKADGSSGYAVVGTDCGVGIKAFQGGKLQTIPMPIAVDGRDVFLDGEPRNASCTETAWAESPVLAPDGTVLYLVTSPQSIGKLPESANDELDAIEWCICSWDGKSGHPTFARPPSSPSSYPRTPAGPERYNAPEPVCTGTYRRSQGNMPGQ
jgi:hypothetical protein